MAEYCVSGDVKDYATIVMRNTIHLIIANHNATFFWLNGFVEICHILDEEPTSKEHMVGVPKINFNALSGEYNPRTLQLKGLYQG